MLAFASDNVLHDSYYIGEANGIAAGKGVKLTQVVDAISLQSPNVAAYLPDAGDAASVFAGIVMFDETMQSDENGVPGWAQGRMARVIRPGRSGGRIYVKAIEAVATTDPVHLITDTTTGFEIGDFAMEQKGTVVQTATPAADAGNTGDGTLAAVVSDNTAQVGVYNAVCVAAATNAGSFLVTDPGGVVVGTATVDVEFVGDGLTFTIADDTTDFVVGDAFTITVTESGATSVALSNARWHTAADAGGLAILELF
jgi:hypothetical protein